MAGILFLSPYAVAEELLLELYEEGDWEACLLESSRMIQAGVNSPKALLIRAEARLMLGRSMDHALATLINLASQTDRPEEMSMAAYLYGREMWRRGRIADAFGAFERAFKHAQNQDLFLHSACSLFLLTEEYPALKQDHADTFMQVNSTRDFWYGELFAESRIHQRKGLSVGRPVAKWIVTFYRSQISSAIAMRCSCEPSCSEYFMQACKKHGLLGFAMQADRFYREPSVVQQKKKVVIVGGRERVLDLVEDHDFWMRKR